jgi:hypothetical protein
MKGLSAKNSGDVVVYGVRVFGRTGLFDYFNDGRKR